MLKAFHNPLIKRNFALREQRERYFGTEPKRIHHY